MPGIRVTRRTVLATTALGATALSLPFVSGARAAAEGVAAQRQR